MNKIYLKNTTVSAEKSVQEIIREISSRHATQVLQDFNGRGVLVGLRFLIPVANGKALPVALPARMDAMKRVLYRGLGPRQKQKMSEEDMADSAAKIVWRQLSAWVKAQMALVDLEMVRPEEVFLPYIQVAPNKTMFQAIAEGGFTMKALKGHEG
jgi:hypothetical protein